MDSISVTSEFDINELAEAFVAMRDEKDRIRAEADAKIAEIEEGMRIIREHLLDLTRQLNVNSLRTNAGTVIRSVRTKYWTNDWESFYRFVNEHNLPSLLEKRISQKNMATFLDDHPNLMPEGLNIDRAYEITVRRSNKQ